MTTSRRFLILAHRYVGIPLSLVFVTWFLSGITMIYTGGMPFLSDAERQSRAAGLDLSLVSLTPADAIAALGHEPDNLPELRMLHGRPLYQFQDSSAVGVFADTGEVLHPGSVNSRRLAAEFLGVDDSLVSREGVLEDSDQWTLGLRASLPLQKFRVEDDRGSWVYVSAQRARVVLHVTTLDRVLAWAGAIPHWFYLESVRENPRVWSRFVVWTATLACLFTVLGLILLLIQWRTTRPFSLLRSIPYRGLHRWHYILGGLFGVFALSWSFSGLLSMEPYDWTREQGYRFSLRAFDGSAVDNSSFNRITELADQRDTPLDERETLKTVRFITLRGEPFLELVTVRITDQGPQLQEQRLHAGTLAEPDHSIPVEEVLDDFTRMMRQVGDGVAITRSEILDRYDDYYYPRNNFVSPAPPLPVLRIELNDAQRTWYYMDLSSGRPVFQNHRKSRLERWLYRGLHSLDFAFWYQRRPVWDAGVIVLLLGGAALSGVGGYLGFRRLLRR